MLTNWSDLLACAQLTYQQAMTASFVEGWFFLILSVTGVRGGLVRYMPKCIALASSGEYAALCQESPWG